VADVTQVLDVRIVDASTATQVAAVSAGGALLVDTELPAAAALADNTSNPTTSLIGDLLHGFDGSTWDRLRTTDATDGTGASTLTGIQTVGAGPGFDRRTNPSNLGTAGNSTSTFDTNGSAGLMVGINTSTTGTFAIEGTADGTNWVTVEAFDVGAQIYVVATAITPTAGKAYRCDVAGMRQVRLRTVSGLGATMAHFFTGYLSASKANHVASGDVPHDSVDVGNPIKVGMKAANALPTAVANADRANAIADLWGRQMTTHIDPAQQIHKSFNATTTQTGADVWSPTSGKKIAVTSVVIGTYGTTAGRVILWFGDNADTTYTAGTDQLLLAFSTAPSANSKPGLVFTPAVPVFCTTADRELHITTDAAVSIDIAVEGYEW